MYVYVQRANRYCWMEYEEFIDSWFFLQIMPLFHLVKQAEKEHLLTYEIHIDEKDNSRIKSYLSEVQPLFHRVI